MKYLQQQYEEVQRAISEGIGLRDVLAIKWYVQELMAEQIGRYLRPSSSILEVGCGGSLTVHFLNLDHHEAVGVDLNETCLHYSNVLREQLGSTVSFIKGDAIDLPFSDGRFDYVYSVGMLEHFSLEKQRSALSEMIRVSRGYVHVELPNPHPLSAFYTIGLRSEEQHLQCNPGILFAESRCALVEVDGRGVFNTRDEAAKNPPLRLFLERLAPDLILDKYVSSDIAQLCEAERATSKEQRLTYGFQIFWIAQVVSFI